MHTVASLARIVERFRRSHRVDKLLIKIEVDPSAMLTIQREIGIEPSESTHKTLLGTPIEVRNDLSPWQVVLIYERTGVGDA